MNGDVRKELCGEQCPTSDPANQEMSTTVKHGSETDLSTEKMTDVSASSTKMKDNSEASMTQESKQVPQNGEPLAEKDKADSSLPDEKEQSETENSKEDNEVPASSLTTQNDNPPSTEPLTREQIKELVSQNVEYFFSRENWSSDPYLLSQMDSDQYVPVYILANCSQFKSITKDHSIIMDVLKDSVFVQLDEENNRVRPNYKRCIVILREIPMNTPVKEIEAMFEGEGCPKSLSCEFVHNDFWYVTFESDSDAQKAYRYLRETVKTFKDKPILARIKTKPMSRIGCFSVLPSYGAKNQGDSREPLNNQGAGGNSSSCIPPGAPAGPGMQGVPNPPPPPNAYPPSNPQRMFYSPQNNMNPSYPSYNFAGSAQIPPPAAYFYPNPMVPWAPNFYDINTFIQYNGLSPRATYKPPSNTRFSNNSNNNNSNVNGNVNRRNKNRDNRFDKSDSKHSSTSLNGGTTTQPRNCQTTSRPQSSHSPHSSNQSGPQNTNIHHSSNTSQSVATSNLSKAETQTSTITNNSSSINTSTTTTTTTNSSSSTSSSSTVVHSSNTFAQNDLSLASQSTLYTSFSSPSAGSAPKGASAKAEIKGSGGVSLSATASAFKSEEVVIQDAEPMPSTSSVAVMPSAVSSSSAPLAPQVPPTLVGSHVMPPQIPPTNPHHYQPQPQTMAVSHRNNFSEPLGIRDTQPQRQITRGTGRRRVSRRDEEINGYPGPGGGRGHPRSIGMAPNADSHVKNGAYTEAKKPFELQATSFPPLPSADEVVSTPEEKSSDPPSQAAWAGETHKFSDVMKGTAKPKQTTSATTPSEKEISIPSEPTASTPGTTTTTTTTTPTTVASSHTPTAAGTSTSASLETGLSTSAASPSQSGTPSTQSTGSTTCAGPAPKPTPELGPSGTASSGATTTATPPPPQRPERGGPFREQRPLRDDRRPQGVRREFVGGIGRSSVVRKEKEPVSFRLSGNKENRPQGSFGGGRSWREDRADPDGWITKTPRDTRSHREHRYQHQQTFYENKNGASKPPQAMVNGDSSPPPSPQPDAISKQVSESVPVKPVPPPQKAITKAEPKPTKKPETMSEKENNNLNNNEGEHKTSWAKMALASKDHMERLSAELKEKEEQERLKKMRTKPPNKLTERVAFGRDREGKPFRRENFTPRGERDPPGGDSKARDFRAAERNNSSFAAAKPAVVKELVPKSPK